MQPAFTFVLLKTRLLLKFVSVSIFEIVIVDSKKSNYSKALIHDKCDSIFSLRCNVTSREIFQLQTRRTFFQNTLQTLTLCCCYLILCESCTPSLTIVCFRCNKYQITKKKFYKQRLPLIGAIHYKMN